MAYLFEGHLTFIFPLSLSFFFGISRLYQSVFCPFLMSLQSHLHVREGHISTLSLFVLSVSLFLVSSFFP